jgi:hypothetical protein
LRLSTHDLDSVSMLPLDCLSLTTDCPRLYVARQIFGRLPHPTNGLNLIL